MYFLNKLKKSRYSKSLVVILLLLDAILIAFAFKMAYMISYSFQSTLQSHYSSLMAIFILAWIVSALFGEVYLSENLGKAKSIIYTTFLAFIFHLFIIALYLYGFKAYYYPPKFIIFTYTFSLGLVSLVKIALLGIYLRYRNLDVHRKKVIIIGYTESGRNLFEFFNNNKSLAYKFMGFFDDRFYSQDVDPLLMGSLKDVREFCIRENIDEMYYALPNNVEYVREIAKFSDDNYIYFGLVQDVGGLKQKKLDTHLFDDGKIPIVTPRREPLRFFFNRQVKRIFDIGFSSLVLVFIFPIILPPIALAIRLNSKGPIFFKQLRSGRNGKPFWCYKFRTMYVNADADSKQAIKNDSRITKVGDFLRKTSLDELPQFYNVFIGDMSVVGPRPHMLKHTEEYSEIINNFKIRHFINSGITGYAQVNGFRGETKDNSMMEMRVIYDNWYLENWSLSLDIKIIFKTVWNAVKGEENAY